MSILKGFEFKRGDTVIHRIDPRIKFFFSMVFLVLSFIFYSPIALLFLFLLLLPLFYVGRVFDAYFRTLKGSLFFLILVFVINFLTLNFVQALSLGLRLILVISSFSIFFLTTCPEDFADALVSLRVPYVFALTFTMSLRFVPALAKEAELIMDAQKSRGLELEKGNFIVKLRNYIPILVPLVVGAVRRSIKVAEAMESRAFGASAKRTSMFVFSLRWVDYVFLLFTLLLLVGSLFLKYYLHVEVPLDLWLQSFLSKF